MGLRVTSSPLESTRKSRSAPVMSSLRPPRALARLCDSVSILSRFSGRGSGSGHQCSAHDGVVVLAHATEHRWRECGFVLGPGLFVGVLYLQEQRCHRTRPADPGEDDPDRGQVPRQVLTAQSVGRAIRGIPGEPVMDCHPFEVGEQSETLDSRGPPGLVRVQQGEQLGISRMDPGLGVGRTPDRGLVHVHHVGRLQLSEDCGVEVLERRGTLGVERVQEPRRDRTPKRSSLASAARSNGRCW